MSNPMDRSGKAPGALGLTGTAGLQLKAPAKKFGLVKPKQAVKGKPASGSVFGAAALEESESVKEELERLSASKHARAAAQAAQEAAMQQDASVFDYDGAYDAMQDERKKARAEQVGRVNVERKAKYIGQIMEAHKEREIENDKIFERKLVREAEAEAHLYGDKEKFLTSAYRKKLQAREEYEAAQRAKAAEEEKEDVTKRSDMTHFYSNLLHGRVGTAQQEASAARDAAYAASFGGKAAGAVPPPAPPPTEGPSGAAPTEAGASGTADEPAAAGEAGGPPPLTGEAAAAEAEASPAAAPPPPPAGAARGDDDLAASIAAANAIRASRPAKAPEPEAPAAVAYDRRNDEDAVLSARERYLQRKKQKLAE